MKAKKTYMTPDTELVKLNTGEQVMQNTLHDTFSGGDPSDTGIIIGGEDNDDDDNRVNRWTNHLWDEL